MKPKHTSRLIAIPNRVIPLLGNLALLDAESIEAIKEWLEVETVASSERRKEILDNREVAN
jgi:hypothetical protein